jgi:uncharacterized membrane protein
VAHAIGFQLTLVVYLIPLIAWWLDMTLLEALLVDLAFIILVPCYTFAYNWAFDRVSACQALPWHSLYSLWVAKEPAQAASKVAGE